MRIPVEPKQETDDRDLRSRTDDKGGIDPVAVSFEAPAPDIQEMTPAFLLALADYEQADMHGTFVKVSRQAVDETLEHVTRLKAEVERLRQPWSPSTLEHPLMTKAADEIACLRSACERKDAEIASLKAEMQRMAIALHATTRLYDMSTGEIASLKAEVERLRNMVRRAYNDGFGEGIKEHTTHKGGTPWSMSKWPAALNQEKTDG